MPSFNYTRLDPSRAEFRLLYPVRHQKGEQPRTDASVEVWEDEVPLRYTIETLSQVNPPAYTALSYTWGDVKLKKPMVLNGATIEITQNLDIALRHLQLLDGHEAFWVDSVCINQKDDDEKSEQVQRMKSIYERASGVIVWLGPSEKDSDIVMDFLTELGKQACELGLPERVSPGHVRFPESQTDERLQALNRTLTKFIEEAGAIRLIDAYAAFVERGWWSRVWVAQEMAVATKPLFVCGNKSTSFEYLEAGMLYWMHNSWKYAQSTFLRKSLPGVDGDEIYHKLSRSNALRAKAMLLYRLGYQRRLSDKDWTLYYLLLQANATDKDQRLQASNERDYIYGLLGLLKNDEKTGITVDYGKDWRLVYIDVAITVISRGNIDLIALGQRSDLDSEKMPSWTPDWRYDRWCQKEQKRVVRDFKLPFVATGAPMATQFSASGKFTADSIILSASLNSNPQSPSSRHSTSKQTPAIILQGFFFARIERTGKLCIPMDTPGSDLLGIITRFMSDISYFCRESAQLNRKHNIYTSQQLREAPWRIPIRDLEMAGETRRLGLLPHRATTMSHVRYRGFTHMLKGFEASQAFEKNGVTSTPLATQHKQTFMSKLWTMIVKFVLLAKFIYHLARFWLQRQKYVSKCTLWVYNKLRYLLIHTVILLGLANRDAASTVNSKIAKSWDDLDETKGELYTYTLITNHSIKPFLTEKGYVGVGTEFVLEGDIICILKGGTVPFVLRPRGEGKDGYWVVGEAFVYGVMDGEFVEGRREDETEIFELY